MSPPQYNVGNYSLLEASYALAIQEGDYRRGAWIAIRGIRTRPSEMEKKIWTMRLRGCLKRRHTSA